MRRAGMRQDADALSHTRHPLLSCVPAGACSCAVAALLSLVAPFPYSLDWRPYFTIHDAAFARLAAGELPTAANGLPVVVGLTNLYFLKVWPELARLCSCWLARAPKRHCWPAGEAPARASWLGSAWRLRTPARQPCPGAATSKAAMRCCPRCPAGAARVAQCAVHWLHCCHAGALRFQRAAG